MADSAPTGEAKNQAPFTNPPGVTTVPQGESKADTPFTDTGAIGKAATAALNPQGSGLFNVRSADQLGQVAQSEVDADIAGQVAPLQAHIGTLGTQEDRTAQALTAMFGNIMPYVTGSAANVKTSYDEAEARQADIFKQAMLNMNQFKQSRAQEAQALAQEMGGPVALSEFTAGQDENAQALSNLGLGQMLHTLGYAQADEQETQAFAGRVMPLVQTEQQARARNYFEDQKKDLQSQIDTLKGTAAGKVTARKNELIQQERQFALDKNQAALDKVKEDHNWFNIKRTLANSTAAQKLAEKNYRLDKIKTAADVRLTDAQITNMAKTFKVSKDQLKLDWAKFNEQQKVDAMTKAGIMGVDAQGNPTLAKQQFTESAVQWAKQFKVSKAEANAKIAQMTQNAALVKRQNQLNLATAAGQWLDAATTPQYGKTVKVTNVGEISSTQAAKDKGSWRVDTGQKDDKGNPIYKYYHYVTKQFTPAINRAMHNPSHVVDFLTSHGIPKAMAEKLVAQRFGTPDYKYDPKWKKHGTTVTHAPTQGAPTGTEGAVTGVKVPW